MLKLACIGGGNMGFALTRGLLRDAAQFTITVSEPCATARAQFRDLDLTVTHDNRAAAHKADIVLLAVKPQVIKDVATNLAPVLATQLVVSIAAGTTLEQLGRWCGSTMAIVRAMPNSPALIGAGITGLIANEYVTVAQREQANRVLDGVGASVWFEEESQLDIVTALSGSGPAYFFKVMEELQEVGEELGLASAVAKKLVIQTALGAAQMAATGKASPAELREQVTSPGGTTEAALQVFSERGLSDIYASAVRSAFSRAKDLGS